MARQFTSPISNERETEINNYLNQMGAGATKTRLEEIREVFDGVRVEGTEKGWDMTKIIDEFQKGLEGDVITGDDGGTKSAEYIKNMTGNYLDDFIADAEGTTATDLEEDIKTDQGEKAVEVFADTGFEGDYQTPMQNLSKAEKEIVLTNIMKTEYPDIYRGIEGKRTKKLGLDLTPETEVEHRENVRVKTDHAIDELSDDYDNWQYLPMGVLGAYGMPREEIKKVKEDYPNRSNMVKRKW